ncbi:MAG: hypothetical protein ACLPN1_16175 [Dissulfurispiraceae bacterium]|jgi:hypothetical protein
MQTYLLLGGSRSQREAALATKKLGHLIYAILAKGTVYMHEGQAAIEKVLKDTRPAAQITKRIN